MFGAGFGDRALAAAGARGLLGRDEAEERRELLGLGKAVRIAEFGDQSDRGEGVDAAQAAQPADLPRPRAIIGELSERAIERVAPCEQAVMAVQVIDERDLRGQVVEGQAAQPVAVTLRPCLAGPVEDQAAAQQELRDAMPGAHQIAAAVLATADRVAELLELERRDRDQFQFAGAQQPGELDRVAPIGLDALETVRSSVCEAVATG